ncbi:ABC transporter ATP-binding protein [Propionibacteriaceae bacterium G57]|uniref:ABC transporter ATP-binding protein n=1 Tax=Aestuariimicrobium sp. G57 TaxID=3418485 RepID=UPI003DA79305
MIEFERATKRYADGTVAVDEFSAIVPARSTTVLLGSSGSGKTTLLRMVNRMVEPTSGRVLIDDVDVATVDPVKLRRSIGYVMQNGGLLPHRRVIENIATVPRLTGVDRATAHDRALELMNLVDLDRSLARRYPHQLSGGQQQRVGVARALAADPNILLMDEPFGAVDPLVRGDLQQWLLGLQRELGKTVVFVTHDVSEALLLGDQIIVLEPGAHIAQQGTGRDILTRPANDFVRQFVGLDAGERQLHAEQVDGQTLLLDRHGRPAGLLA